MKIRLSTYFLLSTLFSSLFVSASPIAVTFDENNAVSPPSAQATLDRACSAVVAVDLASGKAEILTNVAQIANETMTDALALLTRHTDFVVIDTFATGIEDARGSTNISSTAAIAIISNPVVTRNADNVNVTLSWCYSEGDFEQPQMLAATTLTTNAFSVVWEGDPEQFEWGTTNAFRATATLPAATYGQTAFFKIAAQVRGPIDDGQTFDTYEDGTDYWIEFWPTNHFRVRIINGKWTTVQKLN